MVQIYLGVTLLILIAGLFFLIPKSLNYYCREYFTYCPLPDYLRCRSVRYFILSLVGVSLGAWQFPFSYMPLIGLLAILFSATVIFDLELQIIPDWIHWAGIPAAIMLLIAKISLKSNEVLLPTAIAMFLPLVLLAINFVFTRLTNGEGLGVGDIKLLFWLSILSGPSIYTVFALAVIIGLLQNIFRTLWRRRETFPFGPSIIYAFCLFFISHSLWVNSSKFHF